MSNLQNQTKIIAIVHGMSEKIICEFIKRKLKIPMEIIANDNGRSSIQINSLCKFMKRRDFKSQTAFIRQYPKTSHENNELNKSVKIFIIMDTDDCSNEGILKAYLDKSLFNSCTFKKNIYPIYNTPSLDFVMQSMGYDIDNKNKPRSYKKHFPDSNIENFKLVETIRKKLCNIKNDCTNLNIFFESCIDEYLKK